MANPSLSPNGIWIGSGVLAGFTGVPNTQTKHIYAIDAMQPNNFS